MMHGCMPSVFAHAHRVERPTAVGALQPLASRTETAAMRLEPVRHIHIFSLGCRPAVDETCGRLCWLLAERLAVSLVRASPRIRACQGLIQSRAAARQRTPMK